ncbi:MAG: Lrp/AsnC family transcriptional regulator [Lawsonibacter sp.]|nr:Lrp/AsnC family transcriptional regulator [Lawsonibacter sp.]
MDRTDYQILNLLQQDSRTTLKAIGDKVGLTAPAVSERIRRMEDKGVIKSFSINVDRTLLDCNLTGFILVAIFPDKYNQFCQFCKDNSAITSHHHLVGKLNALLRFAVRDTHQLDHLLTAIKQYGDSQTSVELEACFERKEIPLPGTTESKK